MNSRLRNRVTAGAGVLALALALSVLTAALAGAAPSPTQLQRAHDGAPVVRRSSQKNAASMATGGAAGRR